MSQITLSGNAAGTATFTVAAPATSTNQTLTLPDQTSTLATAADVAAAEGMVVLGTITTASGTSQSLTGLNLTGYKQLLIDMNGVSHNSGIAQNLSLGAGVVHSNLAASDASYGQVWVSLWSGVATATLSRNALPSGFSNNQNAQTGYSNATTTVTLTIAGGAFDGGSARVYGVK